jgi:GNAT superfamily N-acetyltransferase
MVGKERSAPDSVRGMARDLLAVAEAPAAHITPKHPGVVAGDGFVLSQQHPERGSVQQIRLGARNVEAVVEEIRALARERGWQELWWWVSDLSEPADLAERLGFAVDERITAMAATSAPSGRPTVEVTRVESVEDFIAAQEIDLACQGWNEDRILALRDGQREAWERVKDVFLLWLARDGGEAVGFARAAASDTALMLVGAGTLPFARGRGVFTSLVHARWQAAVERGTPALVVQANEQSAPILERLGFEALGEIQLLVDRL